MIAHVLSSVLAAIALVALLMAIVPRRRYGPTAEFRTGPLWAWCPAERQVTPHRSDAGARRCLSCKTTTRTEEDIHG
ncbi:hypothetical protein [Streptomyces sp. NPDC006341]|uniref:hypothetical protein n=1 Tax=Streptomyces sp. NPDC006341 TaxID=3156756 RepID=UPI0033A7ACDF